MAEDKEKEKKEKDTEEQTVPEVAEGAEEENIESSRFDSLDTNAHLKRMMDRNFIEYASYVIKDRAIPELNDGLKPVQRRILWALFKMDDGRFHKVANVVGQTMQYHPHGDMSIYDALIVLANKGYFIERQGNFGNILTGDEASAARYIECRLSPLAKETLFNADLTEFTDSYDGRNKEPVYLPAKIPSLLMLGHEGIAPGMTTRILSHNFKELLESQIAILEGRPFEIYPDFIQGGIMDVSDYQDGAGKIVLRAKIEIDGRRLIIREIPAFCTTETLIASLERAVAKNKIKIAQINDYTGEKVEIEIIPQRGYEPEKALKALYAYTDCSMTITSNILVIKDNRPVMMTVSEVLKHYTENLVEYLRKELQIELGKLNDKFHEKSLAQIFVENRIYKRIEECESYELVLSEVRKGLNKFRHMLKRDITDDDIEKLLSIPIRRISLFDINKNKQEIDDIVAAIAETEKNLKRIKAFTIKFIKNLLTKYGEQYPRRTQIEKFDKIDVKTVALNNIKVGWDRKNCFVGTEVKSDDTITCNEFDKLLCVERNGKYKVINIPEKQFVGKLFYLCKYDKDMLFNIVYRDKKTDICYAKRTKIPKFITDKEYAIIPEGAKLEIFNSKQNYIYECVFEEKAKQKQKSQILDFSQIPERGTKSRGIKISSKKIIDFKFVGAGEEENPEMPAPPTPTIESASVEKASDETDNALNKTDLDKTDSSPEPELPVETAKFPEKSKEIIADEKQETEDLNKKEKTEKKAPLKSIKSENKIKSRQEKNKAHPELGISLEEEEKNTETEKRKTKPLPTQEKKPDSSPKKTKKTNAKQETEDDWGISQPELGF